jgi:hypothetical protein
LPQKIQRRRLTLFVIQRMFLAPIENRAPTTVHVTLTTEEVVGQLDPASGNTYR